jgi:hypothetical protein
MGMTRKGMHGAYKKECLARECTTFNLTFTVKGARNLASAVSLLQAAQHKQVALVPSADSELVVQVGDLELAWRRRAPSHMCESERKRERVCVCVMESSAYGICRCK